MSPTGRIRRVVNAQFVKFLLVGFLNTLFGYSVFALLLFVGVHYAAALFFATFFGILFNFKTTGILVFRSRDNRLVFRFFAVYGVCYGINLGVLTLLKALPISLYHLQGILVLPMAFLSFTLNKRFVFKSPVDVRRRAHLHAAAFRKDDSPRS